MDNFSYLHHYIKLGLKLWLLLHCKSYHTSSVVKALIHTCRKNTKSHHLTHMKMNAEMKWLLYEDILHTHMNSKIQCIIGIVMMTQPPFFHLRKPPMCKISESLSSQDWPEIVHLKAAICLTQPLLWVFWPEIQLRKVGVTCIVYMRATAPCSLIIVLWRHAGKCCLATNILPPSLW